MKFVLYIFLTVIAASAITVRCDPMTDNDKRLEKASELIKAFAKEKEPERLREAAIELENVDLRRIFKAKERIKLRSKVMDLWLTIIQTVDKNLDPAFDPNEVLPMKISPPPLKDGTQLPPGADPKLIDDPQARQEYEKAVKENRAKQENYLIQSQLTELNETLSAKFETFIRRDYGETDSDKKEVRDAVEGSIKNEERKQKLLRMLDNE